MRENREPAERRVEKPVEGDQVGEEEEKEERRGVPAERSNVTRTRATATWIGD
jgi:hypothetical protein